MDYRKFIRDPKKVHEAFKVLPDKRWVAVKPLKIYVPARYAEHNLAEIGARTYIVGIFAMVVEDTYFSSSTVNAMMEITPSSMMTVLFDDDEYFEFTFDAGAVICPSLDLVKIATFVYQIYDEFYAKGRVPWFLGYLQMGRLFRTAKKHANSNVGANWEVVELLASINARQSKNRKLYYRTGIRSLTDLETDPPAWIPMRSVQHAAVGTLNKLAGSHFREAVVSALVSPSSRSERVERLLRA